MTRTPDALQAIEVSQTEQGGRRSYDITEIEPQLNLPSIQELIAADLESTTDQLAIVRRRLQAISGQNCEIEEHEYQLEGINGSERREPDESQEGVEITREPHSFYDQAVSLVRDMYMYGGMEPESAIGYSHTLLKQPFADNAVRGMIQAVAFTDKPVQSKNPEQNWHKKPY